jgi:hypothetical protein
MDDTQDGRWLTYAELAVVRGINRASAVKLVQRERWQRSSGNDRARTVRVLVPEEWLQPAKERPLSSGERQPGSGEYTGMLAAIETAHRGEVEALKGQVDALRTLADATGAKLVDAEGRATAATSRAEQAEGERDQAVERRTAAEERAHHLGLELTAEKAIRFAADDEAARLRQAENERLMLGRWRRAWRGWRGR